MFLILFASRVSGAYEDQFIPAEISPRMYLYRLAGRDYKLLSRIILCESGWRADAKNPTSSASGLFQFISSTWNSWGEGDVFNPYDNIKAGVRLFQAKGTSPWLASIGCWKNWK